MGFYLVRHGESIANAKLKNQRVCGEWMDTPLSKKGMKQVQDAVPELGEMVFDKVFSSPSIRTKQTAEIILMDKKDIIILDNRIGEHLKEEDINDFISRVRSHSILA